LFKLNALRHFKPSNNYPLESVANEYLKWFKSKPFDIGKTCMNAFYNAENVDTIINNSNRYNMASLANGALMRAAGIAV
jgi:ADP-ribosyl-[dinitrogen reductase] hydrolase